VTPVEFRGDLWHQKTRVPELSCGFVCVILRLAVLVEVRLVTDTDRHRPIASTADRWHRALKSASALCAVVYVLVGSYSMRPERERRNQLVGRLAGLWDV